MKPNKYNSAANNKAAAESTTLTHKGYRYPSDVTEELCKEFQAKIKLADKSLRLVKF